MNRALGHFCAHTGLIGPGEPPEDGEMSEMTRTALQTHDSKSKPRRSKAQYATSRSRRLPTILSAST